MLFLYWFQQVLLCFPSVINHIHYFQVSLSCYPSHWGNRVEFHSPSKLVGLCGISISQFWQAAENGVQWLRAVIQPAGTASFICCFFSPFAAEIFPFIFLYIRRREILPNLNVNTKHSSLTFYSHFSFHEKQSKRSRKWILTSFTSKYLQF